MPRSPLCTRRDALKRAALSALTLPLVGTSSSLCAADAATTPAGGPRSRTRGLRLGVATISLRDLPVDAVAAIVKQLDIDCVSIFRTHAAFEKGTADECRATAEKFRAAGLATAATSVVYLTKDEAAIRRAFDNVRAAAIPVMTCSPDPDALPMIERFVKETGIRLAIHNHGPEDKVYPSPYEAMKLIQPFDERIGLCLDAGHAMRAGVDPAQAIRDCASRLYDFHLKDSLAGPGAEDIPAVVGRGRMDIKGILAALIEVKYSGAVAFEYEITEGNPVVGLAESVGYVRGLLA